MFRAAWYQRSQFGIRHLLAAAVEEEHLLGRLIRASGYVGFRLDQRIQRRTG